MTRRRFEHYVDEETASMTVTERLIEWSEWASGHQLTKRTENVLAEMMRKARNEIRDDRSGAMYDMTMRIEAVEKAVAHLRFEPERRLKSVIVKYYLARMPVFFIARDLNCSEYHVNQFRLRSMHILSKEIPVWDQKLLARSKAALSELLTSAKRVVT